MTLPLILIGKTPLGCSIFLTSDIKYLPITLVVSRFTDGPDPENVARIRAALNEEFRPNLK